MNGGPTPLTDDEINSIVQTSFNTGTPPDVALLDRVRTTDDYVRLGKAVYDYSRGQEVSGDVRP